MIFAGYEFKNEKPFNNVYFTGIVRDKQGRKMSKSLGNSPDALKLIEDYSADAVRAGMMLLSSGAGTDLLFDESKLQQGKAFSNKILNAFKLIKGWSIDENIDQPESSKIALDWYQSKFQAAYLEIEDHFSKYRLSDALMTTYKLIWDDFCSWLLEMIKPGYQKPIDKKTYDAVIKMFENNLKVLHPFMPFLTEELWHQISDRTKDEALIVSSYPEKTSIDKTILSDFEIVAEVISGIRSVRKDKNISFKDTIKFSILNNEKVSKRVDLVIQKMGNISNLEYVTEKVDAAISFRVNSNEYFIPMVGAIDVDAEVKKLKEELDYTEGFLKSVQKKLSNERFVNNAPEAVISSERKKEADALAKIETINVSLASLS
jgi:valyl-tRNA synthetase